MIGSCGLGNLHQLFHNEANGFNENIDEQEINVKGYHYFVILNVLVTYVNNKGRRIYDGMLTYAG